MRVAIIGCGARGKDVYAKIQYKIPEMMEIVVAVDSDSKKLEEMREEYNIPAEMCFKDADEFLNGDKVADVVFICTLDRLHYKYAIKAMKKGYDLLLEKPISPNMRECVEIERTAQKYKSKVLICHVLRYTPFYRKIKDLIDDGVVGNVVSIQAIEPVSYWHQAHSFVRGNWRNKEETSPMILQKCCHDMDILLWLCQKKCIRLSSFGSLYLFKESNAPKGATERCTDGCPHSDTCPYYAPNYYVTQLKNGNDGWPINLLNSHPTEENIIEALRTGPYGKCVYRCDNNVVDHQVVNLELEGGITVNFTMCAFTKDSYRRLCIMGTMGEISADMENNRIYVKPFVGSKYEIDVNTLSDDFSGHGGGDVQMVKDLAELIIHGVCNNKSLTSIEQSMESHYVAFAAEESRINNGKVIEMDEFVKGT